MRQYEVVKIGDRHEIDGEFFSQDVIEIYPLDSFRFDSDMAEEIYTYIKGVDEDLTGAFPILEFEDGDYIRCVAVLGIIGKKNDFKQDVMLSIDPEVTRIADDYCKDCYYSDVSNVAQWSRLMQICEDNHLLEKVVDFVNMELAE